MSYLTVPFDGNAVNAVAGALAAVAARAPFRLPDAAVHQLIVEGDDGKPGTMLTLWPSIRRVDVISPTATVVFTNIVAVEIAPDVEVVFRGADGSCCIVRSNGKVVVRA